MKKDRFEWLDIPYYPNFVEAAFKNNAKIANFYSEENRWMLSGRLLYSDLIKADTFVIIDHSALNNVEFWRQLFEIVENLNIKRLIFTRFNFQTSVITKFPNTVKEIVLNDCRGIINLYEMICSAGYNLTTVTLRNTNEIDVCLDFLYKSLTKHNNIGIKYLNYYRFIWVNNRHFDYSKNTTEKNLETFIERNKRGYLGCQKACLLILFQKRNQHLMVKAIDVNVIRELVKLIWNSRYHSSWYV